MANLSQAVKQLRKERDRVQRELSRIDAALQALGNPNRSKGPRRKLSLAARRRIAAAQRARWAKFKKAQKGS